jgi:hypothetical protein
MVNYAPLLKLTEKGAADEPSSSDAPEAAVWMGGFLYITLMMTHGQDPIRGLSSAGADGMETGSPCRVLYIGLITEYPITLLYLPFIQGFNCPVHLSSPHRGLSCSESAVHSFVYSYPFDFLSFAGRPQPGHVL